MRKKSNAAALTTAATSPATRYPVAATATTTRTSTSAALLLVIRSADQGQQGAHGDRRQHGRDEGEGSGARHASIVRARRARPVATFPTAFLTAF